MGNPSYQALSVLCSVANRQVDQLTWIHFGCFFFSRALDGPLELDPSSTVFHYAFTLFEGMKAYRQEDGTIRLFRPDMNMARMNRVRYRFCYVSLRSY